VPSGGTQWVGAKKNWGVSFDPPLQPHCMER
jgi:hypothetical protein